MVSPAGLRPVVSDLRRGNGLTRVVIVGIVAGAGSGFRIDADGRVAAVTAALIADIVSRLRRHSGHCACKAHRDVV